MARGYLITTAVLATALFVWFQMAAFGDQEEQLSGSDGAGASDSLEAELNPSRVKRDALAEEQNSGNDIRSSQTESISTPSTIPCRILCVDKITRARLPFAKVEVEVPASSIYSVGTVRSILSACCDQDGGLDFDAPYSDLTVRARDQWGRELELQHDIWSFGTLLLLEFEDRPGIQIEVVDQEGRGLPDIAVALRRRAIAYGSLPTETMAQTRTDARGRATIPYRGEVSNKAGSPCIELDGAFDPPVMMWIDRDLLAQDLVRLVAPPLTRLLVHLEAEDGGPLGEGWQIQLESRSERFLGHHWESLAAWVKNGEADIGRCLGPASSFGLTALPPPDSDYNQAGGSFASTSELGGQQTEVLRIPRRSGFKFKGRLLDPEGVPLRNQSFELWISNCEGVDPFNEYSSPTTFGSQLHTDSEGRFRFYSMWKGPDIWAQVATEQAAEPALKYPTLQLDSPGSGAEIDLSDLTMKQSEILVSGRLLDALGHPVPGVGLSIEDSARIVHLSRLYPDSASTVTDKNGSFAFYDGALRIRSSHIELQLDRAFDTNRGGEDTTLVFDYERPPLPGSHRRITALSAVMKTPMSDRTLAHVRVGSRDIEVRLPLDARLDGGKLSGRLRVPAESLVRESDISLSCAGERVPIQLAVDGSFTATLRPGRYRLEVHVEGTRELAIDGIEVRTLEETWLGELALEPFGEFVEVRLDSGSKPLPLMPTILLNPSEEKGGEPRYVDLDGRVRFWVESLPCLIVVDLEGFKKIRVDCHQNKLRLTLEPLSQ